MNPTFTYDIKPKSLQTLTVNGNPDTVVSLSIQVTATDGTHTVNFERPVQLKTTSGVEFIPFEQLTEAQVLEWALAELPSKQAIETMLTKQLAVKANPPARPVFKAAPWSTCSPV